MAVKGIFASDRQIVGNRVGDFASALLQVNPTGSAPLLALSSGMRKARAVDTIVTWFEENKITGRTAVVSGGTTTTVVVADGSSYVAGVILLVEETGEMMQVTAVSGNSLTVIRGLSGTTIASVSGSNNVVRVGNAHEESSAIPVAVVNQGFPRMNYEQIFRNAWAISGSAKAVQFHTGSQLAKNKSDAAFFHAEDIERAIIWSQKHIGTNNGQPFRIQDGLLKQIEDNGGQVATQGNDISQAELRDFLRLVFAHNIKGQPNERIAFCGDIALQTLNEAVRLDATQNFVTEDTEFGLKFHRFISPFGEVKLMTHPLMNENPVWQEELYIFHPAAIRTRWLRSTDSENFDSSAAGTQGRDADEGVITSEMCVEAMASSTMGIFRGINTAVASGSET